MEITTGQVTSIRFTNPDNGFTVASLGDTDIVGIMPGLAEGLTIEATGQWEENAKWGRQFKVQSFRTEHPTDSYGLQTYLESAITGIGPALAERIVRQFGAATADTMADTNALMAIPGIGKTTAREIAASWAAHEHERSAMQAIYGFLGQFDISQTYAKKLFDQYGFDAVKTIQQNPYKLMDLERIGFIKADAVARAMGIASDDPRRIRAGILHTVTQSTQFGHCYIDRETLIETLSDNLIQNVDNRTLDQALDALLREAKAALIEEDGAIYPARLYKDEVELSQRMAGLNSQEATYNLRTFELLSDREIKERLPSDITYTEEQLKAIRNGLKNRVSIITGGPGTGKSTIIRGMVEAAESAFCTVVLMAPTGLAAKRMVELSGHDAATVHRTLEYDPISGGFIHDHGDPLYGDLFIIDESSMLDISLANSLVDAIPERSNLVFVGDVDQLPSVGPGNVLRDLIDSDAFPVTRLTTIFRQSEDSLIIPNAHAINQGHMPDFSTTGTGDFFLFPATEPREAADWVIDLVTQRIPQSLGIPADEIRVLSPQKKTDAGVYELNRRLQATLNPPHPDKEELIHGDRIFRVGDRILRIAKNDYDRMIVNGDQGRITLIDKDDNGKARLWVKLDDRGPHEEDTFDFTGEDIGTLQHGWALTVHKSQGLEFRAAVVVVLTAHYRMLVRNLLYTGVTRAKDKVIIVGNRKAIGIAVANNHVEHRATHLKDRLIVEVNRKESEYA